MLIDAFPDNSLQSFLAGLLQSNVEKVLTSAGVAGPASAPPYSQAAPTSIDDLIVSCVGRVRSLASEYAQGGLEFDDLVSIGMVKVCEVAPRAASLADPLAYLSRAVQNAMIDELRRLDLPVSLDAPLSGDDSFCLADTLADRVTFPVPSARVKRAVRAAVQRLPVEQRAVIRRRYGFAGYGVRSVAETAANLGISRGQVSSRDALGRRRLRADVLLCQAVGMES